MNHYILAKTMLESDIAFVDHTSISFEPEGLLFPHLRPETANQAKAQRHAASCAAQ